MQTQTKAPSTAEAIAITPIPAKESRTLQLTKHVTLLAPVLGFLPDVIGFLLNLWATNPEFASAVTGTIPVGYRAVIVAIIVGLAQQYGKLRRDTSAPIIGTKGEAKAKEAEGVDGE